MNWGCEKCGSEKTALMNTYFSAGVKVSHVVCLKCGYEFNVRTELPLLAPFVLGWK
jgi:transposase-like protein